MLKLILFYETRRICVIALATNFIFSIHLSNSFNQEDNSVILPADEVQKAHLCETRALHALKNSFVESTEKRKYCVVPRYFFPTLSGARRIYSSSCLVSFL